MHARTRHFRHPHFFFFASHLALSLSLFLLFPVSCGLAGLPNDGKVYNCYARYAWELFCAPLPTTAQEEYDYSCLLSSVLLDGQSIPRYCTAVVFAKVL